MYDTTKPYKNEILEKIKKTWSTKYATLEKGIIRKKLNLPEYHHTDGIGTKGVYHWEQRSFKNAVIDSIAMNLNDIIMERATPYALIDHLMIPEDDEKAILDTIGYLSEECRKRDIIISGGETAIHNNMEGMELSISIIGNVEFPKENKLKNGDSLIGLKSSGIHSNGFTKIGEIFSYYKPEFIEPTKIYSDELIDLNKKYEIHGMMHNTGGAFTKLKGIIKKSDVIINRDHSLKPQDIFYEIYDKGVEDKEIYKTFNCGVGFILGLDENSTEDFIKEIELECDIIGNVVPGKNKIKIESMFSNKKIEY